MFQQVRGCRSQTQFRSAAVCMRMYAYDDAYILNPVLLLLEWHNLTLMSLRCICTYSFENMILARLKRTHGRWINCYTMLCYSKCDWVAASSGRTLPAAQSMLVHLEHTCVPPNFPSISALKQTLWEFLEPRWAASAFHTVVKPFGYHTCSNLEIIKSYTM